MHPVSLEALLLRGELPELTLRPGMTVAARVSERDGDRGLLHLAGMTLSAKLPDDVRAGDRLRLTVQEATAERLWLKVAEAPGSEAGVPVGLALPLPDGRATRVTVEERDAAVDADVDADHAIVLRYDSPELGPLDLRLSLEGDHVVARVSAGVGAPYALADGGADELRAALAQATDRPAQVAVSPRRDPLDLYA